MINLVYNLNIRCKKCGSTININTTNRHFTSVEEERSLGYETEHEYKKVMVCPDCGNHIEFIILVYEYPNNWYNCSDISGFGYFKDNIAETIDKISDIMNNI